jgi:sec-independent protein translocase protein TatA
MSSVIFATESAHTLAFLQQIGPVGLIVILVIALLIFGKRLPDVARSMGKGIVEFKKGLRGVEDDIDGAGRTPPAKSPPPASPEYEGRD